MTVGHRPRRLAICASHPIQYYSPLFRELARRVEVRVFYAHCPTAKDQSAVGFGVEFQWDVDLMAGYESEFLENVAEHVSLDRFDGLNTPGVHDSLKIMHPDAILVLGWHFRSYIQAIIAARRLRIPLLVRGDSQLDTPRSLGKRIVKRLVFPFFLRRFDAALCVGQKSREYWRHYHYPEERLFFSPHCVDNQFFRSGGLDKAHARERLGIPAESSVMLFCGKLVPVKRPLDLIEAAARAMAECSDLCTVFAGSGALEGSILERAEALNVDCRLLGFRNQSVLPAVYAAADALVLPSESETWGLVANEALACGVPVIVSDQCGSVPDLVADGVAGRVYPMGDIDALANAIRDLLSDPPAPEEIAARADAYSVEAAVSGILEALDFLYSRDLAHGGASA